MEPDIRDIEIRMDTGGAVTVVAGCYGPLAVHRDNGDPTATTYSISHRETGHSISGGLARSVAIAVAERLAVDPRWNFRTLAEFERVKSGLRLSLNAALLAHGVS